MVRKLGETAETMSYPLEEIERQRKTAIMRRDAVINDWLAYQSTENLVSLAREDSGTYGAVLARSESFNVQEAVLRIGMANTPETIWLLTQSEHQQIREAAAELWQMFLTEYPEVVGSFIAHTLKA